MQSLKAHDGLLPYPGRKPTNSFFFKCAGPAPLGLWLAAMPVLLLLNIFTFRQTWLAFFPRTLF
ncbi:MAG: hypothetical protein QMD09_13120, partial [Desulfatibacillaceae bacterium]|nr:hypothetical protein [Desulfatibacillaceae bacterium]